MGKFGIMTLQEKRRGGWGGWGESKRKQLTKIQNYKSVLKDGVSGVVVGWISNSNQLSEHTNQSCYWRKRHRETDTESLRIGILKNSSIRSIWTNLRASPCSTTNTNKPDYTTNTYMRTNKQQINAVTQRSYKYEEASEPSFVHVHACILYTTLFG